MTDPEPFEKRARAIVCTKHNYTSEDIDALCAWAKEKCGYLVYGREKCPETGTPHLQIYMELKDGMSYSALNKKLFNAWFRKRRGTPKQAAGYCKKGDEEPPDGKGYDYFFDNPSDNWEGLEFGEISMQGKRTDIDNPVEMIVHDGCTLREVALEHPVSFVKYHRGFTALRAMTLLPRNLPSAPEVIVLWGPTGVGKTRDAHIKYWPDEPHYVWRPSNGQWWDGYDGQKKVIIEEFRGTMPWSDLLGLLDRNEFRAPVKGGFVNIQADKFIITSPKPPHQWYKDEDTYDRYSQLTRRLTQVIHLGPLNAYS